MSLYRCDLCCGLISLRSRDGGKDAVRVETEETNFAPGRDNVGLSEGSLSCSAIQKCKMLLADCSSSATVQLLDLFPICRLERTKDADIERLEFMRSMRR